MKYRDVVQGRLLRRVNRFIAEVEVDGVAEHVHVKNTGRLKEILLPDTVVMLEVSDRPERKTRYSLIAAAKCDGWVNIDSQAPNVAAYEALQAGLLSELGQVQAIRREVTYGDSRFDLYYERSGEKGFIEVKGVTLEKDGIAMFPDAPTVRGTKHITELTKAVQEGYSGAILFVVAMKGCHAFSPYKAMDPAFAETLALAAQHGVQVWAYDAVVMENEMILDQPLPVTVN